jgi:hypothetical protein
VSFTINIVLSANATAISYLAATQATADALVYRMDKQATALLALRDALGFNTSGTHHTMHHHIIASLLLTLLLCCL